MEDRDPIFRTRMTPREAFAAIALVAVACDGVLDQQESKALRSQLECRSPYRDLSERSMAELFDGLLARLRDSGWSTLLSEAVPALTPDQQATALAMAAQLVYANQVVDPAQQEFLDAMAFQVDLPKERTGQILEVIDVLNRDSLAI